jgi:hypothetical protein
MGALRTQYHFRPSPQGLRTWDVHRLIALSGDLVREKIPLTDIRELDEGYWGSESRKMTCREIVGHARLMLDCDIDFPIILSSDGHVMDGMHRICKALLEGRTEIEAVRFVQDPEPDYIGVHPDELPYPIPG